MGRRPSSRSSERTSRRRSGPAWTRTSSSAPARSASEKGRAHEDGSPNRLRIIELRGGKRFVGCEGYDRDNPDSPDSCDFTRPLPGRGYELWRFEERCSICGVTPRLTVKGFRGRPWKLCLNDDCPTMVEMREKRAEREAAKKAREEAKAAKDSDPAAPGREAEDADGSRSEAPVVDTTRVKRATRSKGARSANGARGKRRAPAKK